MTNASLANPLGNAFQSSGLSGRLAHQPHNFNRSGGAHSGQIGGQMGLAQQVQMQGYGGSQLPGAMSFLDMDQNNPGH